MTFLTTQQCSKGEIPLLHYITIATHIQADKGKGSIRYDARNNDNEQSAWSDF